MIDSFPSQSRFAASMAHESGRTGQPDLFLKPVAVSAARLAPRRHWGIYSLPGRARSPFHAEPAQNRNCADGRFHSIFGGDERSEEAADSETGDRCDAAGQHSHQTNDDGKQKPSSVEPTPQEKVQESSEPFAPAGW